MEQGAILRWSLKVLGFVLGFAIAVAFEGLLVWGLGEAFGRHIYPRGLGWIAIPVMVGIGGAALFSSLNHERINRLFGNSREIRMYIAGALSWALMVFGYVFVAEPFGSYISEREWGVIFKWLFIPPLLAFAVRVLFRWANGSKAQR